MKEHEFKIKHDKVTGEWRVWVKVSLFYFWHCWQPVPKKRHVGWHEIIFDSEYDCMQGIEKWKRENAPDYERYDITRIKR